MPCVGPMPAWFVAAAEFGDRLQALRLANSPSKPHGMLKAQRTPICAMSTLSTDGARFMVHPRTEDADGDEFDRL